MLQCYPRAERESCACEKYLDIAGETYIATPGQVEPNLVDPYVAYVKNMHSQLF